MKIVKSLVTRCDPAKKVKLQQKIDQQSKEIINLNRKSNEQIGKLQLKFDQQTEEITRLRADLNSKNNEESSLMELSV